MSINIEDLKKQRNLPTLLKELENYWQTEQQKRTDFYELVHEDIKAEFINGNVIFHSPVKGKHWITCTRLSGRLSIYVDDNDLGIVGAEKVMIRCTRNDYEPDIVFFKKETSQHFTDDQLIFPIPDLAVEILSKSTKGNDYGIKFEDYAAHGVSEYWIINTEEESIERFILDNSDEKEENKNQEQTYKLYQKLTKTGTLKSFAVKDFEIELTSIFK
jgi:Uma2 family endonuclease